MRDGKKVVWDIKWINKTNRLTDVNYSYLERRIKGTGNGTIENAIIIKVLNLQLESREIGFSIIFQRHWRNRQIETQIWHIF